MPIPYITSRWVEDGVSNFYYAPIDGAKALPDVCMYPDAYLDYWSDVYLDMKLFEKGILLLTFLHIPREILEALELVELHRMEPLLPPQEEVRLRLLRDEIQLVEESCESAIDKIGGVALRDKSFIAPMKHHTHRQSRRTHL